MDSIGTHLKAIGAINLALGLLGLIGGLQFFLRGRASDLLGTVFVVLLVMTVPALVAGVGLLQRRRWARAPAYVSAVVSLVMFPIGTAFGIYTFLALREPATAAALR